MIIAKTEDGALLIGLSEQNLKLLREGKPICKSIPACRRLPSLRHHRAADHRRPAGAGPRPAADGRWKSLDEDEEGERPH